MKDGWVDGISKQMSTHIFNNIQARVLVPLAFVTLFSPGLCHQCTEHFPPTVLSTQSQTSLVIIGRKLLGDSDNFLSTGGQK